MPKLLESSMAFKKFQIGGLTPFSLTYYATELFAKAKVKPENIFLLPSDVQEFYLFCSEILTEAVSSTLHSRVTTSYTHNYKHR